MALRNKVLQVQEALVNSIQFRKVAAVANNPKYTEEISMRLIIFSIYLT